MSKKFNPDDYTKDVWMCCRTEEESKDFCRVLHEAGKTWLSGDSYLKFNVWSITHDRVFYNFTVGGFTNESSIERNPRFTILYWSDFMKKEFTMNDLEEFDIVLMRNGEVRIVVGHMYMDRRGYMCGPKNQYSNDLTRPFDSHRDIMAVRRPVTLEDMSFDAFEKNLGRLVYERDETVEMTLEEVCKALGKNVKIVKEAK